MLRFQLEFPDEYPHAPPTVTFLSDVFHPLVTPLTTYSHSSRDTGADPASAADRDRLPPGGLSLRHGFPEWFEATGDGVENKAAPTEAGQDAGATESHDGRTKAPPTPPLTVEVLQYIRIVFDTNAVLDSIPLEAAANTGAWHAWKSYRAKILGARTASPHSRSPSETSGRSVSPRQQQQPGGARRPGEWNWQGVWEDRVRKSVQASNSELALYGGDGKDVVCFSKMDREMVEQIMPFSPEEAVA